MINTSEAYKAAVVAKTRRTRIRVPLRIISPDVSYGSVSGSSQAAVSHPAELHDDSVEAPDYAALEYGAWRLDGSAPILPDDYDPDYETGWVSEEICGAEGYFTEEQTCTLSFSGVTLLQSLSVHFPGGAWGVATAFSIQVLQDGVVRWGRAFGSNTENTIQVTGLEIYNPDSIRVIIDQWSIPERRARIMEIFPGYRVDWGDGDISASAIRMQASISGMTTPYGTATLTIDNSKRLFDPRNKTGLFKSLEERQAIPIQLGVDAGEETEYIPCGVWYMHDDSWRTSDGGLTIRWDLTDIIGLLTSRTFEPLETMTMPTTLFGWAQALVSQLGPAFVSRYTVDPDYAQVAVTAAREAVAGKSCGDILRWLCQATGVFARADAETGFLALEPPWNQGREYTMDNMASVPTISANANLASLIFKIGDDTVVVSGNTSNSSNSATIDNPFITSTEQALEAARYILTAYGGNRVSITGRGDPSGEIGDVATVELGDGEAMTARIVSQTFDYQSGVLQGCKAEMLQADGADLYGNRVEITENGSWTAPAGVTRITIVLVGGGQGGGKGATGEMPTAWPSGSGGTYYGKRGAEGTAGKGGKVWYSTVSINEGQTFQITIGAGGIAADSADPVDGGATTFGPYSSAAGRVYSPSYTDIASGNAYGRTGAASPTAGRGDGGKGGAGGYGGSETWEQTGAHTWRLVASTSPGPGSVGTDGASGCVIVYWEKEDEA